MAEIPNEKTLEAFEETEKHISGEKRLPVFDNYTGKRFMMRVTCRIYFFGVVVGLILAGLIYLGIKFLF